MYKITYLIPVYNEKKTVKQAIEDIENLNYENKEIIVIDNCSTDGSKEIIENIENIKKIFRNKNLGFGKTIQQGINEATGKYIFIQFSDLEYDHERSIYMAELAEKENLDAVIGSRIKGQINNFFSLIKIIKNKPAIIATLICTYLVNKFYGYNFTDIIGGKLYNTDSVRKIPINSFHSGFDFEFFSRMCKRKFKIKEVFIKYKPRENFWEKKIKFYNIFNAIFEIFKVKLFD